MPARRPTHPPLNPRTAMMYFTLHTERHNIEDAAREGDPKAKAILRDPRRLLKMESEAVKNLSSMFGRRIDNEGHDYHGDLVCKFAVDSWAEVKAAVATIEKHDMRTDPDYVEVDVGVPFMLAFGFFLYPDGVNNKFYGEYDAAGTWEDWLNANKPASTRSRERKNPSGPDFAVAHGIVADADNHGAFYENEVQPRLFAWAEKEAKYLLQGAAWKNRRPVPAVLWNNIVRLWAAEHGAVLTPQQVTSAGAMLRARFEPEAAGYVSHFIDELL